MRSALFAAENMEKESAQPGLRLRTGYHRADQLGIGTLIGRTTGEAFTMSFAGQGFVAVQPSEEFAGHLGGGTGAGRQQQSQGFLGGLLDG